VRSSADAAAQLRHWELRVRVASPQPSDLTWLAEALAPAFALEPAGAEARSDRHLSVQIDPAAYDALTGTAAPIDAEPVPCFGFDGYSARLPRCPGPALVLRDPELACLYRVDAEQRHIDVLARHWRPSLRIALLRMLRELALGRLARHQALQLHAAAVGTAAGALLIGGARRAGKTSLLLHLLRSGQVEYLANDRALVRPGPGGRLLASGMPSAVSIRAGTVALFPGLCLDALTPWRARMTLAEALALPPALPPTTRSPALSLTPKQLCHRLGVAARAEAPLAALLFPRLDPSARGIRLQPLSGSRLRERIDGMLMPVAPSLLTGWPALVPTAIAPELPAALSAAAPGYDCILGPDAYADPASAADLLALAVAEGAPAGPQSIGRRR
jgi:hypothetical protein